MKHEIFLQRLGLSEKQSACYLALLLHGPQSISELARRTGLYRTDIYQTMPTLLSEGLVSALPRGKNKKYVAESPKKLEARFLELSNQFDDEMTTLAALHKDKEGTRPVVKYVEGVNGIRSLHDDIVMSLKKGDVYYRYSSSKVGEREWRGKFLSKKYSIIRDQKQLERKVITNLPNKLRKRNRLEREIKVVPPDFDLFEYNITQFIYGNKVAFVDYNTETGIIIENPIIAKFQEKIFQLLFRKL